MSNSKNELEIARKEIFRLKEENLELKKDAKGKFQTTSSTFVTSNSTFGQNGGSTEETKIDENSKLWTNCDMPIAKQNFDLHVIYCMKNLTEWSYCKMKLNRNDLDSHLEEEKGVYGDLLEAVVRNKTNDIETMYEHGNDIFGIDENDTSHDTLLHIAVRNGNKQAAEFLIAKGLDVNSQNFNNETPLHHAVSLKDEQKAIEIIDMMLVKGADPMSKDKLGDTPVEKAKRLGKSEVLLLFSEAGHTRLSTPMISRRL